jgi:hypothetical protein
VWVVGRERETEALGHWFFTIAPLKQYPYIN